MTTGKTIALTIRTFVSKVMSLLFDILSRFEKYRNAAQQLVLLSTTSYITTAFTLASRHLGIDIDTILQYSIQFSKVHKSTVSCRGCTYVTMYTRHMD